MDMLAALLVSEEFQGIVASETGNSRDSESNSSEPLVSKVANKENVSGDRKGKQSLSLIPFCYI